MNALSEATGVPVAALTLVGSLFASYPLAFIHRYLFWGKSETKQNLFFATTGIGLIYSCYGKDVIHSLICTFTQWLTFKLIGHTKYSLYFSFLFQFGYLLAGYAYTETEGYDICWTMPGCVMCLRLIGFAFDRYDGIKKKEDRRPDQVENALEENPSLLETFGYIYNFNGLMIGPQYPLSLHRKLVAGELTDRPGQVPNSVGPGLAKMLMGIALLGYSQVAGGYFYPTYMEEDGFFALPYFKKLGYITITGMVYMYKYISTWTIINGATSITGLGYVKDKETGEARWDGIQNINFKLYWTASCYNDVIKSFNINTNDWVARYIFKRCRWMGSRHASHFTTLMFLAIWHGYHWCYFHMFAYEFMLINAEGALYSVTGKSKIIQSLPSWVKWLSGYCFVSFTWGFCIIDFMLIRPTFVAVWQSIYFSHHIFWMTMLVSCTLISKMMPKTEKIKSS